MKNPLTLFLVVLILGTTVAGCGAQAAADGPPEINYGRDICIECGMIISDDRFAAAYRLDDGTEKLFDDLGDLILHAREAGELESVEVWVSDFHEKVLVSAEGAFFVPTLGVASPMGHGILAFEDHERAEATAHALEGEVIEWETVKALPVIGKLVGDHHHEHAEGDGMGDGDSGHDDQEHGDHGHDDHDH